ncbi:MAG: TIGR00266 family protein, partial [Candidatus Heimdallarchaeota archaeon]|nr:TIGR00266 family protein [Candidatus Heimdallarchaeota archaeon]MCK5049287.1 TIGR00266 family protein [Candidatus Heimdallarchaeota archaeon]
MSSDNINYNIHGGPSFATVEVTLEDGQRIVAESGAFAYGDGKVEMNTSMRGGFFSAIKRKFAGEGIFQNTFTGPGMVAFNSLFPGDILPLDISPDLGWILTKDAYIAGTESVFVSAKWGGFKSMFGGEGLFLTYLKAKEFKGLAFTGSYGAIQK